MLITKERDIYLSVDIEADGPIPGEYSMLSFGVVAYDWLGKEVGEFSANLELLEGAKVCPDTRAFWERNLEAYDITRTNLETPEKAMKDFASWLYDFDRRLTLIGYPVTFDFMFIYWYLIKFTGASPFGFQGLDIKTLMADYLNCSYKETSKSKLPKHWFDRMHSHVAVEDAREQGQMFFKLLEAAASPT